MNLIPAVNLEHQVSERPIFRMLEDDWFSDCPISEWKEDETLYSWCARFHKLNGCFDSQLTSRVLFGHPRAGLRHDIPGHMGAFQMKTRGTLGNSTELLRHRTLFCFHSPFLPTELEVNLLNRLVTGDNIAVRKQLGLERSGLSVVAPLKYCPECVKEQIQSSGVAWWKVSHQLPSSFICKSHGEWLSRSKARQHRGVFPDFQTPSECIKLGASEQHVLLSADRMLMTRLGYWGEQFQNSAGHKFTDATLRHCYLLKAKKYGWLNFDGTVRIQKVRDEFTKKHGGILEFFDPEFWGDLDGVNAGFLAYMFRQQPSRRHPLKHILLLNFMFETFEELIEIKRDVQEVFAGGGEGAVQDLLCESQTALLRLVADGLPVSRAAAEVGVSGSVAGKFLSKNGVTERSLRPHIVGTDKEQELKKMLLEGVSRLEISNAIGVRLTFIKDYLSKRPEIKKSWQDANHSRQIQIHRRQLSTILKQNSDLPIKSIRRLPNNGFQWLFNHDRDWLQGILPAIWKR